MQPESAGQATRRPGPPAGRDRYADLLRTAALGAVVLGHWLMAAVWLDDDGLRVDNVLNTQRWLWPITWVLVLVPLFFLVGGFANATSWRRTVAAGGGYRDYLRRRLGGLLRPLIPFLVLVAAAVGVALWLGAPAHLVRAVAVVVVMPLWFVAVYAALAALAPVMLRLDGRYGVAVWPVMAAGAIGLDAVRFATENPWLAVPNFLLVWGLAQQLGFAYADGRLPAWPRRAVATWAVVAGAALVAATASPVWPESMIGLAGERSNFAPPATPALLLMLTQVPVAVLLRPTVSAWLNRPGWAAVLDRASAVAMPAFLWHLPVLVVVTGLALLVGVPFPDPGGAAWWWTRPVAVAVLAVALGCVLAVTAPRGRARPAPR